MHRTPLIVDVSRGSWDEEARRHFGARMALLPDDHVGNRQKEIGVSQFILSECLELDERVRFRHDMLPLIREQE